MSEPTTQAGKRLLVGLPWTDERERESWARLILAIEAEARADLVAAVKALDARDYLSVISNLSEEGESLVNALREAASDE
jgi:hypothetical protein